jgi:hypothetical protein
MSGSVPPLSRIASQMRIAYCGGLEPVKEFRCPAQRSGVVPVSGRNRGLTVVTVRGLAAFGTRSGPQTADRRELSQEPLRADYLLAALGGRAQLRGKRGEPARLGEVVECPANAGERDLVPRDTVPGEQLDLPALRTRYNPGDEEDLRENSLPSSYAPTPHGAGEETCGRRLETAE